MDSNSEGFYIFPSLPPTNYSLEVSAPGFAQYVQHGITLQADQSLTISVKASASAGTQEVSVFADASQVNTTTQTLSQVVDGERVNDLPLNGRNAASLTVLVAGALVGPVANADQGVTKTFPADVTASINGSRGNQTSYFLDGGLNMDEFTNVNAPFPMPDALQEFSVQTSNYNAQFGENAGGVVNIVTKSGSKTFHGDLFEYVRNGDLNARNYFAATPDPLKRNQFGGTIGGPVMIPHLFSGKGLFFFLAYQGTRIRDLQGGVTDYVPTVANLNGDFSAELSASNPANPLGKATTIVDPRTGKPFPNNQIPTSRFDPAVLNFLKQIPQQSGNGEIVFQQPLSENFQEGTARVDYDAGAKDHLFGRYFGDDFFDNGTLNPADLLTYADYSSILYQNATISETHIFNERLLNTLGVTYLREVSLRGPMPGSPNVNSFGVTDWQPAMGGLQSIAVSGFFTVGGNPPGAFERNSYQLIDDVHMVRGNHNLGFGAYVELSKFDVGSEFDEPGAFSFTSNTTNYALASFMLGYLYTFTQGAGQYLNNRNHPYALYVQDSWKVNRRLTLNYGLRWEPFFPWHEAKERDNQFSPAAYAAGLTSKVYTNAPKGLLFPGDPGVPRDSVYPSYTTFMPRVGFAWDVYGDGKTSLRGGFGSFADTRQPGDYNINVANSTPFATQVTLTQPQGTFSNPYAGTTDPFPTPDPAPSNIAFPTPVTVETFNPDGKWSIPITYEWNLAVEQQFSSGLLGRLAYVGNHDSHILLGLNINPAIYIPGSTLSTNQRRYYQPYGAITEDDNGGNGSYHSLQASLEQRLTHGLTVLANYTFSKAYDNTPYANINTGWSTGALYPIPYTQPHYDRLDRGPSDYDHRNRFSMSYVWQLPKLNSGFRPVRAVVNGWQTNGIVQAQSGDPLTIEAGVDQSQTGLGTDRAVLLGNPYGPGACKSAAVSCKNFLNPASFGLPPIGTFGDMVKGTLTGPAFVDWDTSLFRHFAIEGRLSLEFRAEYFNVLNHTNFLDPVSKVTSAGFGSITSANDPRIAQLAMKLIF